MPRELPIFPLPVVLFPGAAQPLHIFEPRYRQLLADCLAADRRFGIAYVPAPRRPDSDPVPSPGDVGCVALIRSTRPLPDGRCNIVTAGERRFVLLAWLATDRPYRLARVEEFDDEPADPGEAATLAADVREGFHRLAHALGVLTEQEAKRALQALRSTGTRLRRLGALLGPLAADAERRAAVRQRAHRNGRGGPRPQIEQAT